MKAWQKGAIIGGVWGLVSIFQVLVNPGIPLFYKLYEKIAFFPYWFEMTVIYRSPLGVINYTPLAGLLIVLIGGFVGALIGFSYKKFRKFKYVK